MIFQIQLESYNGDICQNGSERFCCSGGVCVNDVCSVILCVCVVIMSRNGCALSLHHHKYFFSLSDINALLHVVYMCV